jgi:hypothetical protein
MSGIKSVSGDYFPKFQAITVRPWANLENAEIVSDTDFANCARKKYPMPQSSAKMLQWSRLSNCGQQIGDFSEAGEAADCRARN